MKKRFLLIVLILFLILPIAYGEIQINSISPLTYNLGDKINLGGYVLRNTNFNGNFNANLKCQESSVPIISRVISINANEKYNFLDEITLPNLLTGNCNVNIILQENNNFVESKLSNEFLVTKELRGNFILVNSKIQLGNDVDVNGEVYKLNGKRVDGTATIYFKKEKNVLFIDTKEIKDGNFNFKVPSVYVNIGSYGIDFTLKDSSGNEKTIVDAINFDVTNLLNLNLTINKQKVNPGDSFEVDGYVRDIYRNNVNKGTFLIKFNDREYTGNIVFGEFFQKIDVGSSIKTGSHNILVEVYDENKNKGTGSLGVNILSKAEKIDLIVNKDSYKPGEKVKIKTFIYDQGGDSINNEVKLEVKNSKNEKIFDKVTKTDAEFDLSLISKPGEWIIKAESGNLKAKKKFYVSEVKSLGYKIEGQSLIITNNGNTYFDENINIKLNGVTESLTIDKKISLDAGESISLDLGKEVKTGVYKIIINDKLFENVNIEGKNTLFFKNNYNIIFVGLVLFLLGGLVLKKKNFFGKNFWKDKPKKEVKLDFGNYLNDVKKTVYQQVEQKERFVRKELENLKPVKSFKNYTEIKPKKNNLDEFRKKSSYLKRRQNEKDFNFKEGMFNMFK